MGYDSISDGNLSFPDTRYTCAHGPQTKEAETSRVSLMAGSWSEPKVEGEGEGKNCEPPKPQFFSSSLLFFETKTQFRHFVRVLIPLLGLSPPFWNWLSQLEPSLFLWSARKGENHGLEKKCFRAWMTKTRFELIWLKWIGMLSLSSCYTGLPNRWIA